MVYDCIIVGAGPGGLSAAVYLGRARQKTLVVYSGPRRTALSRHIQNFFSHGDVTGAELLEKGKRQAERYGVEFRLASVKNVEKSEKGFIVSTKDDKMEGKTVIVASGVDDVFPPIDNLFEFMGETFFHCLDCDGYHLIEKNTCVIGAGDAAARSALGVRLLYTDKITLVAHPDNPMSDSYRKRLEKAGVAIIEGEAVHIEGSGGKAEGVVLKEGRSVSCERILSKFGNTRNDGFLSGLDLKRGEGGYIETDMDFESSIPGLFVIGPLNTGPDQVSVAVGEGARAAMRIIEIRVKDLDQNSNK